MDEKGGYGLYDYRGHFKPSKCVNAVSEERNEIPRSIVRKVHNLRIRKVLILFEIAARARQVYVITTPPPPLHTT